ncbi:MAG: drug resistance transporter, EmrB/QacA subfamily [Streptosporangiaceae bacterium]|nr:drug resistance transporter, EmrB/QacA subfamily [Streptosporangiaceae bacterium]
MESMGPSTSKIRRRRWCTLGVLVVSLLVVVLDNTVLNVALKIISDPREGLGATQGELEWAINAYTLVFAGLLFTFGVLGDRLGRKRVLIGGMAVFAAASLLSAYARTPVQLVWARALMGLGGAAIMPQTLAIITNVFEPHERSKAIGIWAGAVGLGVAIGPVTGGLLLGHFWWGSVFLINVPIITAGIVGMLLLVPESSNPRPGRLDPAGVLLSVVGLVALSYGVVEGGQRASWTGPEVVGPVLGGVAALAAFAWHESHIDQPAFDVRLLRHPGLSAAVGAVCLAFFAASGVFFFTMFYMQSVRGFTPFEAGAMVLPFAAAQLIFSPRAAAMVRRFGPKAVCTTGMLLVTTALGGYQFVNESTPCWALVGVFFVQGCGMANVMPPAMDAIMSALPREKAGAGSAVINTARQVAVAFGVAVSGSVVSSAYRSEMSGHLAVLPEGPRDLAGESIGATMAAAQRMGAAGQGLIEPARTAFVHAMHLTAVVSAVIAFAGAFVVFTWMPGRGAAETPRESDPSPKGAPTRV